MSPIDQERSQILSLADEIWMLVDFLAGSPGPVLSKVQIDDPGKAEGHSTPKELLERVSEIQRSAASGAATKPDDRAVLQLVRDALNALAAPATGLTVAYSTMVTGPLRGRAASRFLLAQQVYASLTVRARWHRMMQAGVLMVAILLTTFAGWQSAKVALGKAILQNLQTLRTTQTSLEAEKLRYELSLAMAAPKSAVLDAVVVNDLIPLTAYRLCDRHLVVMTHKVNAMVEQGDGKERQPVPAYSTPEERDICGRDDVLKANLGIVRGDLRAYHNNWAGMVGGEFSFVGNLLHCWAVACAAAAAAANGAYRDEEFMIAPVLLVEGNFLLPVLFGCIGSAIFVIMDHYTKIRQSLLHPRDFALAPFRLVLGVVVGACIGLFFSSSGPMQTTESPTLISSLSLTASGVAFLAGFGVEGVFSMLGGLVSRVFVAPAAGAK